MEKKLGQTGDGILGHDVSLTVAGFVDTKYVPVLTSAAAMVSAREKTARDD